MTGGKRNEKRDEKIEKFLRAYWEESESEKTADGVAKRLQGDCLYVHRVVDVYLF